MYKTLPTEMHRIPVLIGFWAFLGLIFLANTTNAQPMGLLTLNGPDTICAGTRGSLQVTFVNGNDPFTFVYSINGVNQPPITTNNNPHNFLSAPLNAGLNAIQLESVNANGFIGSADGSFTVFALPAPTAMILSDTLTLCLGQTDTLRIKLSGTPPFEVEYSIRTGNMPADTLPAIVTSDTLLLVPITPPLGTHVYQLVSVTDSLCPGQLNGTLLVQVGTPPTGTLSGDATICDGGDTDLTLTFAGNPPFVFTYTADGVLQAPDTAFSSPHIITVSPTDTTVYALASVSSNGCFGTASGTATINVLPELSATISGSAQICRDGPGTNISIAFQGVGPYTVVYSAGAMQQPPITTTDNPLVIPVNPTSGVLYQLVSVNNGICDGAVSGFALVQVFTPSTAELQGDITVCSNADTVLLVDFTGSGPFLLEYAIDGEVQPIVDTEDDPYLIPVNVTQTTIYTLVSVESPGCVGNVVGTATVFVNYPPTLSNLFISCNLVDQTYLIEFDVTGTPPYDLAGVGGVFTGDHFTSDPIPLNDPYTLLLTDAINCAPVPINGFSNCFCLTYAGDMELEPITGCIGDTVQALFLGFEELEVEDTLVFVLHTNPNDTLGTILDVQTLPNFVFQPGVLTPGVTYYISPVAGNNNGMGGVNLNDPCLSVTPGTPIVWREAPTATMAGDFDICSGASVLIPVTLTGTPNFNLVYTSNGQQQTAVVFQNNFTISATLLENTTFELVSVDNADCPGSVSGIVEVTVHEVPEIDNVTVTCAPDNLTFVLEFDVVAGDLPTIIFVGALGGSYNPTTGHYTSDPQPTQSTYSISISDVWQCGTASISGVGDCPCTTEAGSMDQTPLLLCAADLATTAPAVGAQLTSVDTLLYALVTTNSPSTWSILQTSNTPTFGFDPATMTPGTTYYIFALAGLSSPGGIDLNHPCASVSVGPSVVWQPVPTITLGSDATICSGEGATLTFTATGNSVFFATYQTNGLSPITIFFTGNSFTVPVNPATTATYTLFSGTGNGCPADLLGSATVTVNPTPQILNPATACNPATQTYTLTFSVPDATDLTVSGVTGSFTGNVFTSDPIPNGQVYNLVVSSSDDCTATATGSDACPCITNAGTINSPTLNVCLPNDAILPAATNTVLAPGEVLQYILYQNPMTLPAGILAVSNSPQFAFQMGMQTGITYFVSAVAGLPLPDGTVNPASPCLSLSPGIPVAFHNPPTAMLNGDTTICSGSSTTFRIQFTGTPNFQFVYAINGMSQTAISAPQNTFTVSSNNVQQDQLFTLISVQDQFCVGTVSGTYTINMQEGPEAVLGTATAICPGGSAVLTLSLTGGTAYDVTITGGISPIQLNGIQSGATVTVTPPATTTYTISNLVAQGNLCTQTIGPGVTITVSPPLSATSVLSDYGGFNVSCPGETDGSITVSPNGGTAPITANWSTGTAGLTLPNIGAGIYSVTLTDNIGCTLQENFVLSEPEAFVINFTVEPPACFGDRNGQIIVQNIQGGVGPYTLALNNAPGRVADIFPFVFPNLGDGAYTVVVSDLNGCEGEVLADVMEPPLLTVNLGPDATIYLGDSILLDAIVGGTSAQIITWTPEETLSSPNALSTFAKPVRTTTYKIEVQDAAGCKATDDIRIIVSKERRIYFPNAIKPDAPLNAAFTVYAGPEVSMIRSFRIYDRWGECVFEKFDATPNDPAQGWNGQQRGQNVLLGVYVYVVELEYSDGTTEIKTGDVTVVR